MRKMIMDVTECKPLATWEPIYGDFLICNKLFSTWYGIVTNVDKLNECIEIVYAASIPVLFSLSPTEVKDRKKVMDLSKIRLSKHFSVQQVYGGKSIWYVQ